MTDGEKQAYQRKYYVAHREKWAARHQERKSDPAYIERRRELNRIHYAEHRERRDTQTKTWRENHLDKAHEYERASSMARYWADRDKARAKGGKDAAAAYGRGRRPSKESLRKAWLKSRFGFTPEDWQALFDSQGGLCGICHQPERAGRRLAIDHDHATGRIRGLLCGKCNRQVGQVEAVRNGNYQAHEDWINRADRGIGSVRYVSPSGHHRLRKEA